MGLSEGCSHKRLPYSLRKVLVCLRFYPSVNVCRRYRGRNSIHRAHGSGGLTNFAVIALRGPISCCDQTNESESPEPPLLTALSLIPVGRVSESHQPICPEYEIGHLGISRKGQRRNALLQKACVGKPDSFPGLRMTTACSHLFFFSPVS